MPASGTVEVLLPGAGATDPDQMELFSGEGLGGAAAGGGEEVGGAEEIGRDGGLGRQHVGLTLATVESRVAVGTASGEVLRRRYSPRSPGGVRIPLFLPSVVTRWERDPFSLASVNPDSVEALGRTFAEDNAPTLTRKASDATRDVSGAARVVIRDQVDQVVATQTVMPFESIEGDLVGRLIRTNAVAATASEVNAAVAVARAFLAGAGVTATMPADRQVVSSSRDFVRGYPYAGWAKSVYEVNAFDAYSTEFLLAALFERSRSVRAWVRVDETVPLRISYLAGAVQRQYEPDFIVIDDAGVHWIVEGKRDSEMTSPVVAAKRDAAAAWVKTVNASDEVHETWAYVLASESVCAAAGTWDALKAGAQAFR